MRRPSRYSALPFTERLKRQCEIHKLVPNNRLPEKKMLLKRIKHFGIIYGYKNKPEWYYCQGVFLDNLLSFGVLFFLTVQIYT